MGRIIIRKAGRDDAHGIARVCAAGWRDTYEGIYEPERIEAAIAEYYSPERIAGEIAAPHDWDGWIVAVDDGTVVGAGGGGMIEPGVGELFVLYLDPPRRREGIGRPVRPSTRRGVGRESAACCSTRSPSSSAHAAHVSNGSASIPTTRKASASTSRAVSTRVASAQPGANRWKAALRCGSGGTSTTSNLVTGPAV